MNMKTKIPVRDAMTSKVITIQPDSTLKDAAKMISKGTGIEFEYKGFNDFRDWNRIEEVCNEFIEQLQKGKRCAKCGSIVPFEAEFCKNCGNKMEIVRLK